ncbi:54S ribosomal protein L9, mitochondrial, partial [Tulasnella sp. 408]
DPGRVFKGKKMAGRLGGERTTVQNLLVMRVDTGLNLIYVKGAVPGVDDADVLVSDAKKKLTSMAESKAKKGLTGPDLLPGPVQSLPFPAGTKEMEQKLGAVAIDAPAWGRNPFIPREQ